MVVLYWARAASGTLLEMQASYAAMKLSHSGTPIFSPAVLAIVAGVEAGLALVAGVPKPPPWFTATSVLPHATSKSPIATQSGRRVLFFIKCSLSSVRFGLNLIRKRLKSGGNNTRESADKQVLSKLK